MGPSLFQMGHVRGFPLPPGRLRRDQRVAAGLDDRGDPRPELALHLGQSLGPALVLDHVVQQGRDRFVLVSPVLQHQRGDREQVRDIRDVGALSQLLLVCPRGVIERVRETVGVQLQGQRNRPAFTPHRRNGLRVCKTHGGVNRGPEDANRNLTRFCVILYTPLVYMTKASSRRRDRRGGTRW